MSETTPQQTENLQGAPTGEATDVVRSAQFRRDQIDANHIHEHSGGRGVNPEDVKEYYRRLEMSPEELAALREGPEEAETIPDAGIEGGGDEEITNIEAPEDEPDELEGPAVDEAIEPEDPTAVEQPEAELEENEIDVARQAVLDGIDMADSISDKKTRIEALEGIARKHMKAHADNETDPSNFTFPDLAIVAARRIKTSTQHSGLKAMRVGRTKKIGKTHDAHDALLEEISKANDDNDYGVTAAQYISMPWFRNETLKERANASMNGAQGVIDRMQAAGNDIDPEDEELLGYAGRYFAARNLMRGLFSGQYSAEADIHAAGVTASPEMVANLGLWRTLNNQDAIYNIAIMTRSEDMASHIIKPGLRKKALDEIRKLNSVG